MRQIDYIVSKKFVIYGKKDLVLIIKITAEAEIIVTTLENLEKLLIMLAI